MPPPITKTLYTNFSERVYASPNSISTVEILEYIIFIVILYWYNPFSISSKYPVFSNILTLLVALVYVLLFYFLKAKLDLRSYPDSSPSEMTFLVKLLATLAVFIGSIFLIKTVAGFIAQGHLGILSLFRYCLIFLFLIIAFAGAYTFLKPYFDKAKTKDNKSILSFFFNLVMYLPCLVLAFLAYLKNQYQITTKPMWLLLLAEIILIILWFLVPLALHTFATANGLQLLKEPEYLNKEVILGTFEELYGNKNIDNNSDLDSANNKIERFSYHYSLSFWFYLNPQPTNTSPAYNKFTTILNYGNKPAVEYNAALSTLRVLVESDQKPGEPNKTVEIFQTKKVLFQKWNNMVINYDRGTMDVFLNGELVGSKPSIAPYMTFENIQGGSNNGLHGGISNVMYFKENLSRNYIELMYQSLRGKAEPFL